MRRALHLFVFLLIVLSAFSFPLSTLAANAQQNVPAPYIITFPPSAGVAGPLASTLAQRDGFRVEHTFDSIIKGFSAWLTPAQVSALQRSPMVMSIEADLPTKITDQTVPTGVSRIGDLSNSTASIDGIDNPLNIDIATLDTGIDPTHPDLNVVGGYNCTSSNTSAWADDNGHGTHVAGTIAARDNNLGVVGVAPGARLWAVKVFTSSGSGYVSWIICGLNWVAQHASTIKAVNFSGGWSGANTANCGIPANWWQPADTAHQAVCNLVNNFKVPFVVAAGNDGQDAGNTRPADYPETISVGAIADSDGLPGGLGPSTSYGKDDTRASFSNYGPAVTLYAPGVNIYSTWMGGGYATLSGTSMATPHVTGAVALYLLNHPGATPSQIKQALVANGEAGSWGAPYGSQPLLNVNNAAFGGGNVTPVHDVEVTSIASLNPAFDGLANTIRVHVVNQGNQDESGLSVSLTDNNNVVGSTQSVAGTLHPGDGADIDFSWTPSGAGDHTMQARVWNGDTNHSLSATVTVTTPTHDVEVTSIAPLSAATDGVANTVRIHISNQGNQPESALSVMLTDGATTVGSVGSLSLAAGAGQDVDIAWTPSGVGDHTLTATVSNANTTHSNSVVVNVTAQSTPQNIWVQNLTATSPAPRQITGQVSVAGGTGAIADAVVSIRISGGNWFSGSSIQNIQVTTGANGTANFSVSVPFTSYYTITVTNISHGADTYVPSQNKVWGVYLFVW